MPSPGSPTLILVPTELELRHLAELGGWPAGTGLCEPCGFGPICAAAQGSRLLAELRPARVLLVGIAGSLDPGRAPVASARAFGRVRLDGVGAGSGAAFLPASRLGFPHWSREPEGRIDEVLALVPGGEDELLTVYAAAASPGEAAERRERCPAACAEDMEGFGLALACRLARVPLLIVRGISNAAGERDARAWRVGEALAAARTLALAWLARDGWTAAR